MMNLSKEGRIMPDLTQHPLQSPGHLPTFQPPELKVKSRCRILESELDAVRQNPRLIMSAYACSSVSVTLLPEALRGC